MALSRQQLEELRAAVEAERREVFGRADGPKASVIKREAPPRPSNVTGLEGGSVRSTGNGSTSTGPSRGSFVWRALSHIGWLIPLFFVWILGDWLASRHLDLVRATATDIGKRFAAAPAPSTSVGRSAGAPIWVQQLASHEIVAGSGLAGISIGNSLKETVAVLGKADKVEFIKNDNRAYAVVRYEWKQVRLSIVFSHNQRILNIGLHDYDFNGSGLLPKTAKGIAIGSRTDDLIASYGAPAKTYGRYGCNKEAAELLVYPGLSLWNCLKSRRIQGIDIPGLYGVP